MNPQEINKRIAIACGWKHPNYYGDLNAMHEAIMCKRYELNGYTMKLREVVIRDASEEMKHETQLVHDVYFYHATAAQRAEAFLRTIGQWEDEK